MRGRTLRVAATLTRLRGADRAVAAACRVVGGDRVELG
jgi:hypothetical protein